jgi:hypothetical protein
VRAPTSPDAGLASRIASLAPHEILAEEREPAASFAVELGRACGRRPSRIDATDLRAASPSRPDRRVVVVLGEESILRALGLALGIPDPDRAPLRVDPGRLAVVDVASSGVALRALNASTEDLAGGASG